MSQIDDSNVHDRLSSPGQSEADAAPLLPVGSLALKQCYDAFVKDLPTLLPHYAGQWAAYARDARLGVGPSKRELRRQCLAAGFHEGEFLICGIESPQPVMIDDLLEI